MNTKELIAACRDTADALGDANLRISTTKFDSRSVSDLLWAAAAALEAKCSCGKAGAECSGDRIQGRKDEELARSRFGEVICDLIPYEFCKGSDIGCNACKEQWLGSPAEQEDT